VGKTILKAKTLEVIVHGNIAEDLLTIEMLYYEARRATARATCLLAPAELMVCHIETYCCAYFRYKCAKLFYRAFTAHSEVVYDGLSNREEVEDGLRGTLFIAPLHTCILNFHTIII